MAQPPQQGPGRPRDPAIDAAILDAARRLLARDGYAGMSVAEVAREAGVTKPTLYRRFPSKADLATAAIRHLQSQEPEIADGPCRDRLIAALDGFRRNLLRPDGMAMIGTLLAEEQRLPDLLRLFRERIVANRRRQLRAIFDRASQRGELRDGADVDAAINALVGSFYARYLTGDGVPDDWPERIVDTVWRGLAAQRSHSTSSGA